MRLFALAALLAAASACALPELPEVDDPCATWAEPGFYRLPVDGWSRRALVEVPPTEGPRPAIVAVHGYGASAAEFADEVTTFRADARRQGFVAAFPQGSGVPGQTGWNAGSCCGTPVVGDVDDVGFLDAVTDSLRARVCVDTVVAAGHSNGSMMANRWACASDRPDAVVGSAGPLLTGGACGGDPIPVTMVVGLSDRVVPPEGGSGRVEGASFPAAATAFEAWRDRNGCEGDGVVTEEAGIAKVTTWTCDAPTRFVTLSDWPHFWPGGLRNRPDGFDIEDEAEGVLADLSGQDVAAPRPEPGPDDPGDAPADTDAG